MNPDEREWDERRAAYLHADRAAVDLGMMVLKTGLVINAGALVALLTFLGSISQSHCSGAAEVVQRLVHSAYLFGGGASAATLDTAIAYLYQSGVAGSIWLDYKKSRNIATSAPERISNVIATLSVAPMILLALSALVFFVWGMFSTLQAYETTSFATCISSMAKT